MKRDLAVAAAAAIIFLNSGGGNRLGAIIANGDKIVRLPARSGRAHEQDILRSIATMPKAPQGCVVICRLPLTRCAARSAGAGWP